MDLLYHFLFNTGNLLRYYILPFIVVLGIMIFFHELGHFLTAKYFGVKVLKFALGFGPKIIGKVVGETEYSIRYFPLGGYVKMLGEDAEEEETENLSPEDLERAFNNQHPMKRIGIVAAGPVFNVFLALLLFWGLYLVSGVQIMTTGIGEVKSGSPADKAGILKGDTVISVQGKRTEAWSDIKDVVKDQAGIPLTFTIKRDERILSMTIIPQEAHSKNEFGEDVRSAMIGIVASGEVKNVKLGFWKAAKESLEETWKWIRLTCLVVIKLFEGAVSVKTIGGPILIGQMTGRLVQESIGYLVPFMAIISINLGILNLFPIPILDGGVILFLIIEFLIGRPISLKKRELAQKIGLSLLILLMGVVFYNDIVRLFE